MSKHVFVVVLIAVAGTVAAAQERRGQLEVIVRAEGKPVAGATVTIGTSSARTDETGAVRLQLPVGGVKITVEREGYFASAHDVEVVAARTTTVEVELVEQPEIEEEVVVVATTRTGRRLEDQPTRVEVLGREEIEEKLLMTPGDIVMMLNEMGGMRVQATSPSLGAASVRVQGMKGRYTRFLSDGLPLFGQQVGGLGLLQIPPMDLGQVEVVKGVASALYGAGAMGGVVNLLARRPSAARAIDMLVNRSTLGATDAVLFMATPARDGWSTSLLAGGHWQTENDRDDDGWADVPGYSRGVARPRVFWEGGNGRSAFLTGGVTYENREGGTLTGAVLPATSLPYSEALDTRRADIGGSAQTLVGGRYVLTARGAAAWQRQDYLFGEIVERDSHATAFAELAIRGAAGRHTWVAGVAYERDDFDPKDTPQFAYIFDVPGIFAQDDVDIASWVSLSAGARVDVHDEYGTFLSPRVAALFRAGEWTSRVSAGLGFYASTPLTEETEAAGLSRLTVIGPLEVERGQSVSWDLTRRIGALSVTGTVFASRVSDPVTVDRDDRYALFNRDGDTTNVGAELLATWRAGRYAATGTYAYVRAREPGGAGPRDVALTPRHGAGLVGMWEDEDIGRVGLELYYTGTQRLEVNPYRQESRPYLIVGLLAEKRFGRVRVFVNAENITDVRQTRWDPIVRPTQGVDGRWAVDAWAPLDGRVLNAGVRVAF
ncbi:MAG TPA: TonB-dependent receptor [Vicinamibacterales bacterium]|nr:TonB-dependent receptor [Vicinamibacterales bacterium]